MEDLEYLPSFEAAACFRGEKLPKSEVNVKGRFLTKNIIVLTKCNKTDCDFAEEVPIKKLKTSPEPRCPICYNQLNTDECIIEN